MQEIFKYDVPENLVVKNEKIKGLALKFEAKKTDGSACDISNLNKIGLDVILEREGETPFTVFTGYFNELLHSLYAQTPRLLLQLKKHTDGYLIELDFGGWVVDLIGADKLTFKIHAISTAFTSLSKANSNIHAETIPATGEETPTPQITIHNVGLGKQSFDEMLGENIVKIVFIQDFNNPYDSSNKCKLATMNLNAMQETDDESQPIPYTNDSSENLLIIQNKNYLDMNPESHVQDLVLYQDEDMLDNVHLKLKLEGTADNDTKITTLAWYDV